MNTSQSYSVVIPAYNAARTLGETLDSVFAQAVPPLETIVVDDGSTDNTAAIARGFGERVRVFSQTNQGPGAATSLALRQCRAPIIASVDADDLWLPHKMKRQLDYLQAHPQCAAVFAQLERFGVGSKANGVQDGWLRTTLVMRAELYVALGDVIDPPGKCGEMIDWFARAREAGFLLVHLPEVLARRRIAPGSLSYARHPDKDRAYLHAARAALLRRRAA